MDFEFLNDDRKIKVAEYQSLRKSTTWNVIADDVVSKALKNDLFSVCIFCNEKLVGIGRVVGDGAINQPTRNVQGDQETLTNCIDI